MRVVQGKRLYRPAVPGAAVFDALPPSSPNYRRRCGRHEILHRPQPYPRLAADDSGNVFLAFRTSGGDIWGPLGTT